MPSVIRERRKIRFQGRIITPSAIRRIAELVHQSATSETDEPIFESYLVDAVDDSSYESRSVEIFESSEIIESKQLSKIQMIFRTISQSKNIEVQIQHSNADDHATNFIIVSGDDSIWVTGMIEKLHAVVRSFERQTFNKPIYNLSFLLLLALFNICFFRLFYDRIEHLENEAIKALLLFGVPIGSMIIGANGQHYINAIWPDIELQTGPNYMQLPQKKRQKVRLIITLLIIPLIVTALYELIKNQLRH